MSEEKSCFVVGPIGSAGSEIRRRSDQIYKYVIKPVTEAAGYAEPLRSDMMADPGLISDQIVAQLVGADLVVADLTGANPNVFYELAVRHALRKPFLQLTTGDEPLPFDVSGVRTVRFDHRDLDEVDQAKRELANHLEAVEKADDIRTPLSFALNVANLGSSEDAGEQAQGEMLFLLREIFHRQQLQTSTAPLDTMDDSEASRRTREARMSRYQVRDILRNSGYGVETLSSSRSKIRIRMNEGAVEELPNSVLQRLDDVAKSRQMRIEISFQDGRDYVFSP